ncbi:Uncharacterised protein [Vibrio cholerae]|nr:Uncharacterised protein [Vibrio cholerae]CSI80836.1 Uncharacterised protein [Vibrio cholerae]
MLCGLVKLLCRSCFKLLEEAVNGCHDLSFFTMVLFTVQQLNRHVDIRLAFYRVVATRIRKQAFYRIHGFHFHIH